MDQDTAVHLMLAVGGAAISGLFTAGGFYIYVRMSITHIEEWGKENHDQLEKKIDKNFETLDTKIKDNHAEMHVDLAGIGGKVNRNERDSARRYHNLTAAVMLASPPAKENQIAGMLREDS